MTRAWPWIAAAALSSALAACNRQTSPDASTRPVPGTSGTGAADATGQAARPGTGLNGGLGGGSGLGMTGTMPNGTATQSAGAGPAPDGTANRTTHNSVGNR